jgi:hypothetical protein
LTKEESLIIPKLPAFKRLEALKKDFSRSFRIIWVRGHFVLKRNTGINKQLTQSKNQL